MNETFKKIEDLAQYVQEHAKENREMATVIIAAPNMNEDEGQTLCGTTGKGVNIIEMLAMAFAEQPALLDFAKEAIFLVEGLRVTSNLEKARAEERMERKGCDNEQPTTTDCNPGCDGDPVPTCAMPESDSE